MESRLIFVIIFNLGVLVGVTMMYHRAKSLVHMAVAGAAPGPSLPPSAPVVYADVSPSTAPQPVIRDYSDEGWEDYGPSSYTFEDMKNMTDTQEMQVMAERMTAQSAYLYEGAALRREMDAQEEVHVERQTRIDNAVDRMMEEIMAKVYGSSNGRVLESA